MFPKKEHIGIIILLLRIKREVHSYKSTYENLHKNNKKHKTHKSHSKRVIPKFRSRYKIFYSEVVNVARHP